MTQALPVEPRDEEPRLPTALPQSTVSEIASWLVGHTLDEVEREMIQHTLDNCGGDRVLAASVLGVSLPVLRRKLTAYAVRGQALREAAAPETGKRARVPVPQPDNDAAPVTEIEQPDIPAAALPAAALQEEDSQQQQKPAASVPLIALQHEYPAPVIATVAQTEQKWRISFRLLAGCSLTALLIGLTAFSYFGKKETPAKVALPERPRIEVSRVERPVPAQLRVTVPAWNAPTPPLPPKRELIAEPKTRAEAVVTAKAPVERAAAPVTQTPAAQTIALPDSGQDTIAGDAIVEAKAKPAPVETPAPPPPARDAFAGIDTEADTRMDSAPAALAAAQPAADSAPEITGSLDADAPFVAPAEVPALPERPAATEQAPAPVVRRQAVRPRPQAQPAFALPLPAAEAPKLPIFPFFNIFAPRDGAQRAAPFAIGGPSSAAPEN